MLINSNGYLTSLPRHLEKDHSCYQDYFNYNFQKCV
ncbi:hypothetical protein SLEP1_g47253 [Rubroshorea leprosula]|uniref:Uncharacterized protein n=1 Tax=Rubroshorea leprosula TaxID=152421 RepID=A0AAV5LQS5_9ROSI|nr:hypothetical protein SLEP1_g47253 [Rubroshorea leprosula]